MAVEVYLVFDGDCRQAVEFYSQVFGTEITDLTTFGDTPQHPDYTLPEEAKNRIMHARLEISGSRVMFSDTFPGQPFVQGNNVTLALLSDKQDELKEWFEKLKDGGIVEMELQETFWSKLYGRVTDKFGIHWQLSHEV